MNSHSGIDVLESLELHSRALFAKGEEDGLGNCVLPNFSLPPASDNTQCLSPRVLSSQVGGRLQSWVLSQLVTNSPLCHRCIHLGAIKTSGEA